MSKQFDVFAVRGDEQATINVVEAGSTGAVWDVASGALCECIGFVEADDADSALSEACNRYLS